MHLKIVERWVETIQHLENLSLSKIPYNSIWFCPANMAALQLPWSLKVHWT
jgi:hypothetical protein